MSKCLMTPSSRQSKSILCQSHHSDSLARFRISQTSTLHNFFPFISCKSYTRKTKTNKHLLNSSLPSTSFITQTVQNTDIIVRYQHLRSANKRAYCTVQFQLKKYVKHWIVNFANFTTFAFLFFYKIIAPDKVLFCSFRMTIEIILFYIYLVIFFKKSQSFKHSILMHNLFARRNNDRDILSTIFRVDKSLFYVSKSWKSCNIIDTI